MADDYRKSENIFAIISAINEVLSVSNEPRQLLEMFLDTLSESLDIDCCWVQLIDSASRRLSLAAYRGFTTDMKREIASLGPGWNFSNRIVGVGHNIVIPDLTRDREHNLLSFRKDGVRWLVAVPVRTYRVQGILGIASRTKKRFSSDIADLLVAIAGQLGLATDKANLFQITINNNEQMNNQQRQVTPDDNKDDIPHDLISELEHFAQEWKIAKDRAGRAAEQLARLAQPLQSDQSAAQAEVIETAAESRQAYKIKVFIIDRNAFFLRGLSLYLSQTDDIEIIGQSDDFTADATSLFREEVPDIAVVDVDLPTMGGIDLASNISQFWPGVSVIMLTPYLDDNLIIQTLQAGVSGYISKSIDGDSIAHAIRDVFHGEGSVNRLLYRPGVAQHILHHFQQQRTQNMPESINRQELAILEFLASGRPVKQASTILGLNERDIEESTTAIINKLTNR